MLFRLTHDDQMRAMRAREANGPDLAPLAETGASAVGRADALPAADRTERHEDDPPVQLSRELIDAAIERGRAEAAVKLPAFTVARRMQRLAQARGGMKAFLAHARTVQTLPSFAMSGRRGAMKGRRE